MQFYCTEYFFFFKLRAQIEAEVNFTDFAPSYLSNDDINVLFPTIQLKPV